MPVNAAVANTVGEECKIEPRTSDRAAPRRRAHADIRFLSVAVVAERLCVSVRTIRRWTESGALPDELRVVGLNWWTRCGWRPCVRQMRWTELALISTAFAIIVAVQWVASTGASVPGKRHNTLGDIRSEWGDARGPCLITQEAVATRPHKASATATHRSSTCRSGA